VVDPDPDRITARVSADDPFSGRGLWIVYGFPQSAERTRSRASPAVEAEEV
jgi:hypothetical protein